MTGEIAKRIVKGITDKIECNTADIDDWAEFWGFTREEYEELLDMPIKALEQEPTPKNDLGVDREDAVERLNAIKQLIGYDKDSEIVKATQKSLDMAIKALEHPEKNVVAVVPCGDCISREQALKELKESAEHHANDSREEALLRRDRDIIRALPSVTPQEPKIGHWAYLPKYKDIAWYCSECKHFTTTKHNYCPNCGAKMVEPQESER